MPSVSQSRRSCSPLHVVCAAFVCLACSKEAPLRGAPEPFVPQAALSPALRPAPAGASASQGAASAEREPGWTSFPRAKTSVTYYVSSSTGRDANDGRSEATAFATLRVATKHLSAGDWLLLKRGDVFAEPLTHRWANGLSSNARTLIGAYGALDRARPIVDPGGDDGIAFTGGGGNPSRLEHFALSGVHLRQSKHDPSVFGFDANAGSSGISVLRPGRDFVVEDVLVEKFGVGLVIDGGAGGQRDFCLRRSVIVDNYGIEPAHAQGILVGNTRGVVIEENVFDHNGHYPGVAGAHPTVFNHNIYVDSDHVAGAIVRDNIIARAASHGFQLRPGGLAERNVLIGNAIAGFVSNSELASDELQILRNNVVVHPGMHRLGKDGVDGARGWGLGMIDGAKTGATRPAVEVSGNILAHAAPGAGDPLEVAPAYRRVAKVEANVIYDWGGHSDAGAFTDPARSIPNYQLSLGAPATVEAFLTRARGQRRGRWLMDCTAQALRRYFVEGFTKR